jgi:IS1 family transposase
LINYSQVDFLATTTQFNALIQQRLAEQQIRPTLTRTTKDLNNDIKMGVRVVRNYLFEKYKDENIARSYYTDFGIEYKNKSWKFPTDQQYILIALNKAKAGVITHGFGNKDYGTAFWTTLEASYTAIVQTAITSDGSSSTTVFQKNTLKKEIQTVMTALRNVIRGNYGAGANAVMRDLGFQKEKA